MVQLNTKILHHGMPCQISQTFSAWLNGEGWSKQVLSSHNIKIAGRQRTISKATNRFLKAEDLRVLGKSRRNGPKCPYRTPKGVSNQQPQTSTFLCSQLSHSRGKELSETALEVRGWRALRGKHGLGCRSSLHAGTNPDSIPSLRTGQQTHRGASQKATSSHQINAGASTLASFYTKESGGPLRCCRKARRSRRRTRGCPWSTHSSWRGAEGINKGQEKHLAQGPHLARRAGQPGGPCQWDRLPELSCGTHSGAALNHSAFF